MHTVNFSNVIIGVLLILIGYQIKGNIKLIKKYVYIYVVNLLIFIGLFLWTRSFTIQNLYDAVLPITRNTYPIVLGAISALLIKDKLKNCFKKYRFPVILSGYAIVFTLPSIFNKDIFGIGNGNNAITAFLLVTLGILFSNVEVDKLHINKKVITLMSISVILNIILALSMPFISWRIRGDFSTAYRFNVLTSISVVAMSVVIFIVGQRLKLNIKIPEYTGLLVLLAYSNNFIVEKTVNGSISLKVLLFKSCVVSVIVVVLGWLLSKIDKKDLALEKSLLLDDSKSINVCARSLKPYIVADIKKYRFSVMNIIILYILAYMSFILMSPDFSAPHLGKDHTNIFFYTFFVRQHMLILNTMLFYLLYRFIYGIIGRFWTSVILNYAVIAVAIVADAIKTHYRTEPILPTEVTMVSAYGDILSMLPQFILWITAIVIIILICIVIYCERKLPQNKAKWRFRILGIVLAVLVYGSSTRINHEGSIVGDFLNSYGNLPTFENQEQGAQQNGALQQFLNNIDVTIMKKETDYSKKKVDKLAAKYSKLANKINATRNNNFKIRICLK